MSHVYVLALTDQTVPSFTIDGRRAEFIGVCDLFAAIERRSKPPTVSEQELRSQHDLVTAIFNRVDSLLPVQFGTWLDRRDLSEVVAEHKGALTDALELVRNRVQMTIRFIEQSARRDAGCAGRPRNGTEYLHTRREVAALFPNDVRRLQAAVKTFVIAERSSKESPAAPKPVRVPAASLYQLIERASVPAYVAATHSFQSNTMTVTGPWPPFAFAPNPWP